MSMIQELVSSGASTEEIVAAVLESVPEGPGQFEQRSLEEIGERMLAQDTEPLPDSPLVEAQALFVRGELSLEQYTAIYDAVSTKVAG